MPTFEETRFRCNNEACGHSIWASYEEDSAFLPGGQCPKCNAGEMIDSDEKREVNRPAKKFIDE